MTPRHPTLATRQRRRGRATRPAVGAHAARRLLLVVTTRLHLGPSELGLRPLCPVSMVARAHSRAARPRPAGPWEGLGVHICAMRTFLGETWVDNFGKCFTK